MGRITNKINQEDGFSLVESLVTILASMAVLGALLALLTMALKQDQRTRDRAGKTQELQVAMERIAQEIRQATTVYPSSTQSAIEFDMRSDGVSKRVRYSCSAGTCARYENGSLVNGTFVTGLAESSVFEYAPSMTTPDYVSIEMRVRPADPSPAYRDRVNGLAASTGVSLRNSAGQL